MYDEIFQTLEFVEYKTVPPCIWYNRYKAVHRGEEIIIDCIVTYSMGLQRQVTIHPHIYSVLEEFITDEHYPNVPISEILICIASQLAYYEITNE